jgi:RimJ/RimL family protein N-acetyltransferase
LIEGKSTNLRALEAEDLMQLRDWRNTEFVRETCREYRLLNMEHQKRWFDGLSKTPPDNIMFGIENKKGQLIGVCGLTWIDWKNGNAEVSIYIGEKAWQGKGAASDSLRTLVKYGFEIINLHRIYAIIFEFNEASIKLFEKCGFRLEGKQREAHYVKGRYWDELIYGMLREEYDKC